MRHPAKDILVGMNFETTLLFCTELEECTIAFIAGTYFKKSSDFVQYDFGLGFQGKVRHIFQGRSLAHFQRKQHGF